MEHEGMAAGDNEDDFDSNIKDLEFRLKSNVRQLQVQFIVFQLMNCKYYCNIEYKVVLCISRTGCIELECLKCHVKQIKL